MISYVEGILVRDINGDICVVEASEQGVKAHPIPTIMHPFAARGMGHRYGELERASGRGAQVLLTIASDPNPMILEIDEISSIDPSIAANARALLGATTARAL